MNRVALDFGVIQIYWYSICILIGLMIGMFLVYKETSKKDISDTLITNLIFYTVIISIIGARVYYVAFDWGKYSKDPIEVLEIWNGGLAIHGAIIFGGLFLIYYTKHHKMDTLKILDICSVGLIIGQAIGRWGNFFNSEVYGKVVSEAYLKGWHIPSFIIDGMYIDGDWHHPLFLYESLWCLLGFILLLFIRRRKYIKTGQIFGLYCMWYSLIRFFLEGMRDEQYNLMIGDFKIAQIISVGMFVVGLFFFLRRLKTSRFEHLYNDDNLLVESNVTQQNSAPFITKSNLTGPVIQQKAAPTPPTNPITTPPLEVPNTPQMAPTPMPNPIPLPPQVPIQSQGPVLNDHPVMNQQNNESIISNQNNT